MTTQQETKALRSNRQIEKEKELLFHSSGPFIHVYTSPLEDDLILKEMEDRYVTLAYMAMAAAGADVEILAYAMMSNHFHFIIRGLNAQKYFDAFLRRLSLYFSRHGRPGLLNSITAGYTEITSLKQFRDDVAYVIRNPFVVREDIHVFAYPWTSGFLYFNPFINILPSRPIDGLSQRQKREITKSRDVSLPKGLELLGAFVNPASFVNYKLVESLFVSARQFTLWTLKNVEAQVETATRLGEKPNLPDEELLSVLLKQSREHYGHTKISELNQGERSVLAQSLKYDYYASNKQIARMLNLTLNSVNELFPMSSSCK